MHPLQLRLLLLLLLSSNFLYAGNPVKVQNFINCNDWNFVENKGQIATPNPEKGENGYDLHPDIKYYGHQGGVYLYCKPGTLSFVFTKVDKENTEKISEASGSLVGVQNFEPLLRNHQKASQITTSRVDLILVGSNQNCEIIASDQQEYFENFYLAHTPEEGITNVHTFKTVTYKNIYPNIDMVIHAKEKGMKYEFVVYPGGNISDIKMQWNGLQNIEITENGGIKYSLGLGRMEEGRPVSWQGSSIISSTFTKSGNRLGFKLSTYNRTRPLIIDPVLVWGTYFGGSPSDTYAAGVITDGSGNVYITGQTVSTNALASKGVYQTTNAGYDDAYIAKFSPDGKELWATYYGGKDQDMGLAISTDKSGYVYITGESLSTTGIATKGAYQDSINGTCDAFLAKFGSSGNLVWATYFGGNGTDYGNGISIDNTGSIYFTGFTNSKTGLASSGCYQSSFGGYKKYGDAFLAKFNISGKFLWATYLGGSGDDYGTGISTDSLGYIYMTGYSTSSSGIATSGSYQSSYSGGSIYGDAFLSKFNSSGSLQWSTYFGGSNDDPANAVCTDVFGNVYITGYTASKSGIASSGAFKTSISVTSTDAFLAKFNSNGVRTWATYFGGPDLDQAFGICADISGNVYITGWTSSTTGIATKGAYQTSFAGVYDVFLAKFNKSGNVTGATYYGGSNQEIGLGIFSDQKGNIYLAGNAVSKNGVATSGAFHTSNTGEDGFLAKFIFQKIDAGISKIGFSLYVDGPCISFYPAMPRIFNYGSKDLYSADVGFSMNGKFLFYYHWKGLLKPDTFVDITYKDTLFFIKFIPGNDTIRCWTARPNGLKDSFPGNDTSILILNNIPKDISAYAGKDTAVCSNISVQIGQENIPGDSFIWTSYPPGFYSFISNPVVKPTKTTRYYLQIKGQDQCNPQNYVDIKVIPPPEIDLGKDRSICLGDSLKIGQKGADSIKYSWRSRPFGFTGTLPDTIVKPDKDIIYVLTATNKFNSCTNSDSVKITVNNLPKADIGKKLYEICTGSHIRIGGNQTVNLLYSWSSDPIGFTSSMSNPVVNPSKNTTFYLSVKDTITGCVNQNSANVTVSILKAPVADAGKDQTICMGTLVQIGSDSMAGNSYSWSSMPVGYVGTHSKDIVRPIETTSCLVNVIAINGCQDLASLTINVNPRPKVIAGANQNICSGTVIQLGSNPLSGYDYSWYSHPVGIQSSASKLIDSPKASTIYFLKETISATGCTDSDSVFVKVVPRPNISFKVVNGAAFIKKYYVINPNYPAYYYKWDFGDGDTASGYSVSHTYSKNDTFRVVLRCDNQPFCTVADSQQIIVQETFSLDIFPNPFGTQTEIHFILTSPAHIKIVIFDVLGREITTLFDKSIDLGEYNTVYQADALNTRPGIYLVTFIINDKVITKKIIQLDSIYY